MDHLFYYRHIQSVYKNMSGSKKPFLIVNEQPEDQDAIHQVNLTAFKGSGEACLVNQLRMTCPTFVSLVAKMDDQVVGHILFTPVDIICDGKRVISGMGLAPLAVLPEFQGMGIGSALCEEGLKVMARSGTPFVIVLGHPQYYPRFSFERASNYGVRSSFEGIPDEVFMIRVFDADRMSNVSGVAHYQPEFDSVT